MNGPALGKAHAAFAPSSSQGLLGLMENGFLTLCLNPRLYAGNAQMLGFP